MVGSGARGQPAVVGRDFVRERGVGLVLRARHLLAFGRGVVIERVGEVVQRALHVLKDDARLRRVLERACQAWDHGPVGEWGRERAEEARAG